LSLLDRLKKRPAEPPAYPHDAPDLEATLPSKVAGRPLGRWSVSGDNLWKMLGGDRLRAAYAPLLATLGVSTDEVQMAVAGRSDTRRDPPYIIQVFRFGKLKGTEMLLSQETSGLAMLAMGVDANRGPNWQDSQVAGRWVLVGNRQMVHQDSHHRGLPIMCVTPTAIYSLIADEDEWAAEVIGALPTT
jgi:hypothetical protein